MRLHSGSSAYLGCFICLLTGGPVSAGTEMYATNPDMSEARLSRFLDPKLTEPPPDGSWSRPENWGGTLPQNASDVGVIGTNHSLSVDGSLGQAGDRPVIRIEKGGTLWFAHDFDQPLKLTGGELRELPRKKAVCGSDIEIAADSTITSRSDSTDAGRMQLTGKIWNSKPAPFTPTELTLGGDIQWMTDCHSTLSSVINISTGTVYVYDTQDSSWLGSGEIRLFPETRLYLRGSRSARVCQLTNDIGGAGTIRGGEHPEGFTLAAHGITLHPGLPGRAGTLSVMGNFAFENGPANHSQNKIVIEVQGPGAFADKDFSQLVLRGRLTDSLDTVDLELIIDPALPEEEVQHYSLNVVSIVDTDITRFKPFHSVIVRCGKKTGRAQVQFQLDPEVSTSSIVVTGITFPD